MDRYEIIKDRGRGLFAERLNDIYEQAKAYLDSERQQQRTLCYTKVFLSDISNQEEELRRSPLMTEYISHAASTIIQQSPIGGAKIGVLMKTSDEPQAFTLHALRLTDDEVMNFGSYMQTVMLFDKYLALLQAQGLNLKDHCVRQKFWFLVRHFGFYLMIVLWVVMNMFFRVSTCQCIVNSNPVIILIISSFLLNEKF